MENPVTAGDLQNFDDTITTAAGNDMLETAWARAVDAAPCIAEEEFATDNAVGVAIVKDTIRSAVLRWHDRGSGAHASRNAGEYGETLRAGDTNLFRPNEIRDLQRQCSDYRRRGRASTILTSQWEQAIVHADWCSMVYVPWPDPAPQFCDCGALLTGSGRPLYSRPGDTP